MILISFQSDIVSVLDPDMELFHCEREVVNRNFGHGGGQSNMDEVVQTFCFDCLLKMCPTKQNLELNLFLNNFAKISRNW